MTQAFTADDLYLHQRVSELHCVSGVPLAVAALRSVDREADKYVSRIWSFSPDGSAIRQLTQGPGSDSSPRLSPDGRTVAFLSDRGGAMQVYLLSLEGGEARQLGQFDGGPSAVGWAHDNRTLIVTAAVSVDPDWRGARGSHPAPRGPKAAEVAWKLPYKSDGLGYTLAREIHLFTLDAQTGESRQLTDGPFDVLGCHASSDSRQIAYVRTREGRFAHATDLWVCDIDGKQHRQLTHDLGMVMEPVWSPDGRWIFFTGSRTEGDAQMRLWLVELASGRVMQLGNDDVQAGGADVAYWSDDSTSVFFSRAWKGRHQVARIAVPGGKVQTLIGGDRQLGAFGFDGRHFYYPVDTAVEPCELHVCDANGSNERRVSDLNPWWKDRPRLKLEAREFRVPDGKGGTETIHGWLLRREGATGPMPLLDDVHGGPAAYVQLDYDTNVFWQVLCGQGWAVLALDAVGSASYGSEFCQRLQGHWGEYDFPQHMEAIRQLRAQGICDERVAISGKSYGGYMSAWAIGHTHDFRAAVVMAPVGNVETHYGTSDGGYYADPLYTGSQGPVLDRERARQLSPLQYVECAKTPTLFMQGKEDERCPKCQSEELFVSMLRAGETPAELVLYPGEDHHFLGQGTPSVRADAARRIVDWLNRHTGVKPQGDS
jgi:dipeptidyl aminopeptidase/acylaminoacyl peptidase